MKLIFMGTPDFSVPCLQRIVESGHSVDAVFSQPDKPVGRKQILTPPPVKTCALGYGIPVYQPKALKNEENFEIIKKISPDAIIVVAYGKILPPEILTAAKYGCINVHASLLPKYRGAAPIQRAVLNGESETGVTIMQMDQGLDTGDILLMQKTQIGEYETSGELFERLSQIGADTLVKALEKIEKGECVPQRQPAGDYGYAAKITKDMAPIDWSKTATQIINQIRGLQPWPCAETVICGKTVKIHKALLSDKTGNNPGETVDNKNVLTVCCGDGGCIDITQLQPQGKKQMSAQAFLAGNKIPVSTTLG